MKPDREIITTALIVTAVISAVFGGIYLFNNYNSTKTKKMDTNNSTQYDLQNVANNLNTTSGATSQPTDNQAKFTELIKEDTVIGTGEEAKPGKTIFVNYTGKLTNGTVFDSSVGKSPIDFVLGSGRVIQGWDKGFDGMKVGGKRTLKIPAALGYGAAGSPPVIPANADLIFDVELVKVQD